MLYCIAGSLFYHYHVAANQSSYVAACTSDLKISNPAYANKIPKYWKNRDDNQLSLHQADFADTLTICGQ